MKELLSQARAHGLATTMLEGRQWRDSASPDASLSEPLTRDPIEALDQLRRRGLEPALVQVFWTLFEHRPVELGLFAWDVLNGALLPPDDEVNRERLRRAARVVQAVLPEPGEAFTDTHKPGVADLVSRVALPAFQDLADEQMDRAARFNALGAIEANQVMHREHGRPLLTQPLAAAHGFARYLHLAHLPTLATFYLDYLVRRCEYAPALSDFVEVLLDAGTSLDLDRENILWRGGQEEVELANYALGRVFIRRGLQSQLNADLRTKLPDYKRPAAEVAKTLQHSHLLVAHSFLAEGEAPVPFEVVNEIVRLNPGWRYAARVRLAMLARFSPPSNTLPLKVLDGFLETFGDDYPTWKDVDESAPSAVAWLDDFYSRLVREVVTLPHSRAAWESLGVYFSVEEQEQWEKLVRARVIEQATPV